MAGTNYSGPAANGAKPVLTDDVDNAVLILGPSPVATKAGYAIGCIALDTTTGIPWVNTGTAASCSFVKVSGT